MKRISLLQMIGAVTLSSTILAGCGGGGDPSALSSTTPVATSSPTSTPAPEPVPVVVPIATVDGVYNGTTSANRSITALILADNSYYFMYSKPNDSTSFDGVAFGSGTSSNGIFSSSDFKDINLDGTVSSGTLSATYDPKQTFTGTLTYADNTTATFSSAYNNVYTTAPTLTALAGAYTGTLAAEGLSESGITLTIMADGTMSGQISCGCKITATITPLASGNAYGVRLAFTGGDHPLHDQTFTGSAYFDAASKRLLLIGLLDATKAPAIFVGLKP